MNVPLTPEEVQDYRKRFFQRRAKITRGLVILGVLTVWVGGAGLGFILIGLFHHYFSGQLIHRGQWVPVKILQGGDGTSDEYFGQMLGRGGSFLLDLVGRFLPVPNHAVVFEWQRDGKTKKRQKLLFTHETVEIHEDGRTWALMDRQMNPCHYLITRI